MSPNFFSAPIGVQQPLPPSSFSAELERIWKRIKMRKANNIQAWRPASAAEVFPAASSWFPDLQDLRCFIFGCFHDLDAFFWDEGKDWRSEMKIVYTLSPTKTHTPTQPTSTPNLNPNGDPTEPSHRSGQERMKYIEKVLGDSAEEHAKLLAKQKKEFFFLVLGRKFRGNKTLVVFWKPCFFFFIHGRMLSMMWKKVWYWV